MPYEGLDAGSAAKVPAFSAGYLETLHDGIGHALATRAVEGKYVAEERPDVIGERRLQKPSRAMQSRLDGFGPEAQQIGRLLDAHALDDARDEDRAEILRQLIDGALDQPANFALGNRALWVHGFVVRRMGRV